MPISNKLLGLVTLRMLPILFPSVISDYFVHTCKESFFHLMTWSVDHVRKLEHVAIHVIHCACR